MPGCAFVLGLRHKCIRLRVRSGVLASIYVRADRSRLAGV